MASHRHKTIPREIMGNQRSCRCKFKTKFILEVPNMFKGIWLWMWEVDRVIFCPVAWSIPFNSGIGLPLLIISRLDWKSSFENCFSAQWCFEPSPSSSRQRLPGRWLEGGPAPKTLSQSMRYPLGAHIQTFCLALSFHLSTNCESSTFSKVRS